MFDPNLSVSIFFKITYLPINTLSPQDSAFFLIYKYLVKIAILDSDPSKILKGTEKRNSERV